MTSTVHSQRILSMLKVNIINAANVAVILTLRKQWPQINFIRSTVMAHGLSTTLWG